MNHKYLTKSQKQDVLKYLDLISSNDIESMKLGITLFYEDHKDKQIPCPPFYECGCYYIILPPEESFKLFSEMNIGLHNYWTDMVGDLLTYGYYET